MRASRSSEGDVVVTIDGDLQDDPAEIPRLLAKLDEGYDLVSGWKTHRNDPFSRRAFSRVFNGVTGWLSGVRLHDMNCGLKAMRATSPANLDLYGELHRFVPVLAHDLGFRVTEIGVNHRPREHGHSRYGMERYARGFLDLLTVDVHEPLPSPAAPPVRRPRPRARHDRHGRSSSTSRSRSSAASRSAVARCSCSGVLLVVVGIQFLSLGLVSELVIGQQRGRFRASRSIPPDSSTRSCAEPSTVKALYLGTYDRASPRNTQVVSCLRGAGVEVVERHRQVWGRHNWSPRPRSLVRLARAELALSRIDPGDADVLVVGYPGHADMAVAKRVADGRPVVFNPLVSLADTLVDDRAVVSRRSPLAAVLRGLDRSAFRRADLVVADTEAHAAYFRTRSTCPRARRRRVVGAEDSVFRPAETERPEFHVLFVGKLIPLHGLETILAAARLAPDVPFVIAGEGQLAHVLTDRPANVEHVPWIDYRDLPAAYGAPAARWASSEPARRPSRVIPNKVFQALACARPVITADTPGRA